MTLVIAQNKCDVFKEDLPKVSTNRTGNVWEEHPSSSDVNSYVSWVLILRVEKFQAKTVDLYKMTENTFPIERDKNRNSALKTLALEI